MVAVSDLRACGSVVGARPGRQSFRGWFFAAVHRGNGVWDFAVRIRGIAVVVSNRVQIHAGAMGFVRHHRNLVGQFASRLHVLQPSVVACAFGVRGSIVFLVLAANAGGAHARSMDNSGVNRRIDVERVLPKRNDSGAAYS